MNILFPAIVIFVISVLVLELCFYSYNILRSPDRQKIRKRLKTFSATKTENDLPDITRNRVLSNVSLFNNILLNTPGIRSLDRLLQQANTQYSLGFFIFLTGVLVVTGYFGTSLMTKDVFVYAIIPTFLGSIPFLYLRSKKKKRMGKFLRQLPDGLELIARALLAGHAFTSGLKLAASEFDDPLGPEFEEALDEINFGISVSDALKNLASRIDCPDLRYFVVSVILQRETGGNLAEILQNIANIIRQRFKFEDKIRVLSAEGKLSAVILIALPFVTVAALHLLNAKYISLLFSEHLGRMMIGGAILNMIVGILVMKRMVNIKV